MLLECLQLFLKEDSIYFRLDILIFILIRYFYAFFSSLFLLFLLNNIFFLLYIRFILLDSFFLNLKFLDFLNFLMSKSSFFYLVNSKQFCAPQSFANFWRQLFLQFFIFLFIFYNEMNFFPFIFNNAILILRLFLNRIFLFTIRLNFFYIVMNILHYNIICGHILIDFMFYHIRINDNRMLFLR